MKRLTYFLLVACIFCSSSAYSNSILNAGNWLNAGEKLVSNNGIYELLVQSDGNVVLEKNGVPIWHTGTYTIGNHAKFSMQTDGNLVLYDASWNPKWSSGTWNIGDDARLSMQNDGNLVVYDSNWSSKWSSGTWQAPETPNVTIVSGYKDLCSGNIDILVDLHEYLIPFQKKKVKVRIKENGVVLAESNKTFRYRPGNIVYGSMDFKIPHGGGPRDFIIERQGPLKTSTRTYSYIPDADGGSEGCSAFFQFLVGL